MLPADPYHYHQAEPHAGGMRPLCQGDVFVDVPLLRAAVQDPRHPDQWKARIKAGPNALGMLLTHPCSSRARDTGALKQSVLLAPVVPCPAGFNDPWGGFYEYFPLPNLRDDEHYAADLSATCPVGAEHLAGHRLACLGEEALAVLFHRLALNSSRLERIPDHFAAEAQRLFNEMSLWEKWATAKDTENGFQAWLDSPLLDPPIEDESGSPVAMPADPPTPATSRREALRWDYEHIEGELDELLKGR